jgi:excisionase family DNA binding protein
MATSPKLNRSALTSGQAAQYCFVSVGTIQNWLNTKQLQGQRTAGGRFRIRVDHLRQFMLQSGMSVEALDKDFGLAKCTFCWEFFSAVPDHCKRDTCHACIVRKTHATNCFELRKHVDQQKVYCTHSCEECEYWKARLDTGAINK